MKKNGTGSFPGFSPLLVYTWCLRQAVQSCPKSGNRVLLGFWIIMAYLDISDVPHTGLIQVQCRMLGEIHFLTTQVAVPEIHVKQLWQFWRCQTLLFWCWYGGIAVPGCTWSILWQQYSCLLVGFNALLWLLMFVDNIQIMQLLYKRRQIGRRPKKGSFCLASSHIFSHSRRQSLSGDELDPEASTLYDS